MNALRLPVKTRNFIVGKEMERILRSVIPQVNLSCEEKMNKSGSAIGKKFLIHYPEFGPHLVMVVTVGNPPEDVICEDELYKEIWVEVQKLQNAKVKDFLKDLNNPDRDIVTLCQNVRDAYQKALSYVD